MGAEIKQTLERGYDVVLSAQDIRGLNFAKLTALQNPGSGDASSPATPAASAPSAPASPAKPATNGVGNHTSETNGDVQVSSRPQIKVIICVETKKEKSFYKLNFSIKYLNCDLFSAVLSFCVQILLIYITISVYLNFYFYFTGSVWQVPGDAYWGITQYPK